MDTETNIQDLIDDTGSVAFLIHLNGSMSEVYLSISGQCESLSLIDDYDCVKKILETRSITKVGIDIKGQKIKLAKLGIDLREPYLDLGIASYLLDSTEKKPELTSIATQRRGEGALDTTTLESCCLAIDGVHSTLVGRLKEHDLGILYDRVEMPLIKILADMESQGVMLDRPSLKREMDELVPILGAMQDRIFKDVGHEFNIAYAPELGKVLHDELGLRPVPKTKTGYSADKAVLSRLRGQNEIIPLIEEYRGLWETFKDMNSLFDAANGGSVIWPTYIHTGTETGRFSTKAYNIQGLNKILRRFIIPRPGHVFIEADYSQAQFRILAHLSEDPALIKAFRDGKDFHSLTASEILKNPARRTVAKEVNFGIIFGMTPWGLAETITTKAGVNVTTTQAKGYIDGFYHRFPCVRRMQEQVDADLDKTGYVTSLAGRKRFFNKPGDRTKGGTYKASAKRAAFNMKMQGSEADIIKLSMIRLDHEFRKRGLRLRILIQVHDSLVFEVPVHEKALATVLIKKVMESVFPLRVPMKVDIGAGASWGACKQTDNQPKEVMDFRQYA